MKKTRERNGIKIKPFRPMDLIVYAVVLVLVLFLFFYFVIIPKTDNIKGFMVKLDGQKILTFEFDKGITETQDFSGKLEIVNTKDQTLITIYTNLELTEFNVIAVSLIDKTVEVLESNCSVRKDCVHSPKINQNGGMIACMPHGLKILSLGSDYIPLSTGGVV